MKIWLDKIINFYELTEQETFLQIIDTINPDFRYLAALNSKTCEIQGRQGKNEYDYVFCFLMIYTEVLDRIKDQYRPFSCPLHSKTRFLALKLREEY